MIDLSLSPVPLALTLVFFALWAEFCYSRFGLGNLWAEQFGVELASLRPSPTERAFYVAVSVLIIGGFETLAVSFNLSTLSSLLSLAGNLWLCFAVPTAVHVTLRPKGGLVQAGVDLFCILIAYLGIAGIYALWFASLGESA